MKNTISTSAGIVVGKQFYTMEQVAAAMAGIKGTPISIDGTTVDGISAEISGCRRGDAVLLVPTAKGLLLAYDNGGGDEYPGVNVDLLTQEKGEEEHTLVGMATVEYDQTTTEYVAHVFGDMLEDAPTDSIRLANGDGFTAPAAVPVQKEEQ